MSADAALEDSARYRQTPWAHREPAARRCCPPRPTVRRHGAECTGGQGVVGSNPASPTTSHHPSAARFTVTPLWENGGVTVVEAHDRVESRISELMGIINLATAELVELIGEAIESETWTAAAGIRSIEHWVTWQCSVTPRRAADLVPLA